MGKMLKDKIGNKQEFSFWVFFDLLTLKMNGDNTLP